MITSTQYAQIAPQLPLLDTADPALVQQFQQQAFMAHIPAGQDVFAVGDHTESLALLLSGVVRVYQVGETGREITLYRFGGGQSCILTVNAILNQQTFPAIATVEQAAVAVMIPAGVFRVWVNQYELWRQFVFDLLSQRLTILMSVVDEVVFRHMDRRVAALLCERASQQNPLKITHQEIAAELGSSREVISRLLEEFVQEKIIQTRRGVIEVLHFELLRQKAFG